jgi:hypothetical protein
VLNLFYEEPDPDRWLPFDRYPRALVRRMVRGKPSPGGQQRVFLNLCAGLDRLGVRYRVNDFRHARRHPEALACIIGKPQVLDRMEWRNPILFGASVFSHPLHDVDLLARHPIRRILVPGEWMRSMFEPYYGEAVAAWPVGIDTERWKPRQVDAGTTSASGAIDFLIYDKVRWKRALHEPALIEPIRAALRTRRLSFQEIRYGSYREEGYHELLQHCRAMIFLCEHETQGIAYQQALAAGVPILAWDRGGYWQDPEFYPHLVQFAPVTSVPYWDERCGLTFDSPAAFEARLDEFRQLQQEGAFQPRDYILEHLTLERSARAYLQFADVAPP